MGVRGLASLVESHGEIYRKEKLMHRRLVIDGSNMTPELYEGLDEVHGGQFAALEKRVERFVSALRACRIQPFILFDGGMDPTDKKRQTATQSAEQRVSRANQAALSGQNKNIIPMMAKLVFRQTLVRMEVPVAMCYEEADQEIAALAKEWECPVLSNDSDFYILDLPAGLLPISHFQWESVRQTGNGQSYIPCKRYYRSRFCDVLEIRPQLLPAFAVLAGNDYVNLNINWALFCNRGNSKSNPKLINNPTLGGLLCWLKGFQEPQKALEAALALTGNLNKKQKKIEALGRLKQGMEEYKSPPSSLRSFFMDGVAPPFSAEIAARVPEWMRQPLTQTLLTPDVLDVLQLRRMDLSDPVDHMDSPPAHLTSRPLRQLLYWLLLGGDQGTVTERDRDGIKLKFVQVPPACSGIARGLKLSSLHQVDESQRRQVLLEALGVTEASLAPLPLEQRLPVAVTCYWLHNAEPRPDESLQKALLLGMSDRNSAIQITSASFKQCLDLDAVHSINQWQSCLKAAHHLNQLLCSPLPEPHLARLYDGSRVHQMLCRLKEGFFALKQFLKCDPETKNLYLKMQEIIQKSHAEKASSTALAASRQQQQRSQRRPVEDVVCDLNLRRLFENDVEEEKQIEIETKSAVRAEQDMCLSERGGGVCVRTRHRAKERKDRSKSIEMARKHDCSGLNLL